MSSKKILIVDDDPQILDLLGEKLSLSGYGVFKAQNGLEAMKMAQKEQPALIILDLLMPVMGGAGAVIALKDSASTKKIPIFFLTGADLDADELKREKIGVDFIFHKPFSLQEVMQKVREVIGPP